MNKYKEIIEFINIAEGLKRELRHSWLSDGRRESVAEHTWSMSLLAFLLFDEIDIELDQLRVLKMIIIHDMAEIYAGDIPSFNTVTEESKRQKEIDERKALEKLLSKLSSKKLKKEIEDLWEEFEAKETPEAKFAQACDKADAIIQHNNAHIDSFEQGDYDLNPYYKDQLFNFSKIIRALKDQLDIDTMEKIEKEGDITRVSEEHRKKWEGVKKIVL